MSKPMTKPKINVERLASSIKDLSKFGRNESDGLDRTTFTTSELEAREWLKAELEKIDLDVRVDEAANIWAKRQGMEPTLPVIAFGSHIDTVPNGGKYDGALGVLMALEVMKVLEENDMTTRHPFELVSFSAEEPNPFGLSTFGSRAITGKLKKEDIVGVKDANGTLLTDALRKSGGNPDQFEAAVRESSELSAYVEVHIEQGKRLLNRSIPVGVVSAITGIYREEITVFGEANHAGTTLMEDRKDALSAASELILALEEVCRSYPENEVVGTVGKLNINPNSANIIPAQVDFTLEIRGKSKEQIEKVLSMWTDKAEKVKQARPIDIHRKILLDQPPAPMDEQVIQAIEQQAKLLNYESLELGSMAGHDATHMASITKSGMLFVPSIDGKSHCPEEESQIEDIEIVANVLLHSLLALDKGLDVSIND
ncbi:Zn-dependent hydrolase [Aquibacillus albus]|uniref:N-carbamoyl-L-amino-acid hydrolase n=1 Tax=Aquibacillus albus TaxID=1168171 RepID=A0ABS2MWD7_9BACI|nr:Zn-dependent hydrolase [Aquibacillus albus]MBM7570197.1 N-carbamoyl-L-amino-acid hydrolase [Aquibacillus albus]